MCLPPNPLKAFEELLLLRPGGATVYFGPLGDGSELLINYFQASGWGGVVGQGRHRLLGGMVHRGGPCTEGCCMAVPACPQLPPHASWCLLLTVCAVHPWCAALP